MRILGVDPGYGIVGIGIVEVSGNRISHVFHGTIETPKNLPAEKRLKRIYEEFLKVLERFSPDECAMEKLFFVKNVTTAIGVGEARGVLLLALAEKNIPVFEYAPNEVKVSLSGYGRASKKQIQENVKRFLNLSEIPRPDDAADALAIAWCHALQSRARRVTHEKD
ncbi:MULTISPECIES: crossover junction endodeoxyribonuclease RuvC [unclassified Thermotoga]|uniref:crossover junction endodeoxyribonuclease RuvC n=1 Tax=unclassified Thermotoga TaxID=2631113 RepID=UPI000280EABD|nr:MULTISPECIES: crossover junction endodeoxyribonuclease RuvC [unclassified Thermotoga]AIY85908.1 Holliday junction resolvase [Thermotoga sp. 2812B]EJX26807.1 Holliday junction resolvase [Thermotoga sp. EMP]